MDFFIQIVATFENAGEHDLKLLDLIAQELGLDDKEYQDAKHKNICECTRLLRQIHLLFLEFHQTFLRLIKKETTRAFC